MYVSKELNIFFIFVIVGMLLGSIFDIFRALRKIKKTGKTETFIQDIIYFIIVGVILLFAIYYTLNTELRIHIFIAILLGIVVYVSTISNVVIKFYVKSMENIISFIKFVFLPIVTECEILKKIIFFLNKIVIKCCKIFKNMVSCTCLKAKKIFTFKKKKDLINKRGIFNGFKRKEKIKKSEYKLD